MKRTAFAVIAIFTLAACGTNTDSIYSGTLQVPSAAVGSTVAGRVVEVLVSDGSRVRTGAALLRFDDAQTRAALQSATARLSQAQATLADLLAGPRAADL